MAFKLFNAAPSNSIKNLFATNSSFGLLQVTWEDLDSKRKSWQTVIGITLATQEKSDGHSTRYFF
jgi:hypothetical protein